LGPDRVSDVPAALSDRLLRIETVEMGLPGDRERALRVADRLIALRA
jgi:hypothetical protein